jgi:hypothetical protein
MTIALICLWCAVSLLLAVRLGRLIQRGAARATDADHVRIASRRVARGRVA